jgi:DNA repair protein SbcD/Mre11
MRILHTADWHLGKKLDRFSRIEEQKEVMQEIVEIADRESADVVLIAGDIFDSFNPPADAQDLFYRTVHRLSNGGRRPVIAIAGNHDMPERMEAPIPLASANAIILQGFPHSEAGIFTSEGGVELLRSAPGFIELRFPGQEIPLRLLLTPYANELRMKTFLGGEAGLADSLRDHWNQLASTYCDDGGVNILMAHLYVHRQGSAATIEDDGERSILHVGGAPPITTNMLPDGVQYVALGHLHGYQLVDDSRYPVVYSSSPLSYSFAEAGQVKKVVLLDVEPGKRVEMRKIDLTKGMPLLRGEFDNTEDAVAWLKENPESYVELTIRTSTYLDGAMRKIFADAHERIVDVVPKIIREDGNTDGTNLPDSIPEADMNALFRQYFVRKYGTEPSDSVLALFREISSS